MVRRRYDGAALAAGLDAAFGADLIDLLVVDGPPAFDAGMATARAPALPVLWDRLAPGATVVLDDIERPGEQEVLRRWEGEFDVVSRATPPLVWRSATCPHPATRPTTAREAEPVLDAGVYGLS